MDWKKIRFFFFKFNFEEQNKRNLWFQSMQIQHNLFKKIPIMIALTHPIAQHIRLLIKPHFYLPSLSIHFIIHSSNSSALPSPTKSNVLKLFYIINKFKQNFVDHIIIFWDKLLTDHVVIASFPCNWVYYCIFITFYISV